MKSLVKILMVTVLAMVSTYAQGNIKTVAKLHDLKLLAPSTQAPYAMAFGNTAANDGGGGLFKWTPSSALSTNYAVITSTIDSSGQWIRVRQGASARIQTLTAAAGEILAETETVILDSAASITITNIPTIAAGSPGQRVTLVGTHDTNTQIISDQGTLAGSNITLATTVTNRTLGKSDTLTLVYIGGTITNWCEVAFTNN